MDQVCLYKAAHSKASSMWSHSMTLNKNSRGKTNQIICGYHYPGISCSSLESALVFYLLLFFKPNKAKDDFQVAMIFSWGCL